MSNKRNLSRGAVPTTRERAASPTKLLRPKPTAFVSGSLIAGRYVVSAKIGAGGMGVVHAATEVATGRDVAIKALNATAFTTENLRRFRREAEIAARVRHPHLCAVHYLGVEAGTPFIVMERLRGETVRNRVAELGPFSAADAVMIILQVLDGLSAAHAAGVVHRDVKPANIFITTARGEPPNIKIIDFGLAKPFARQRGQRARDEEVSTITTTDMVPGTPYYLAPEQVAGVRDIDHRIDVWAAGLVLFEMLTGRRAFDGSPYARLAASILLETLPPLSSIRSDIPPGLDDVFERAIAKDRDERFPTAAAFRSALIDVWARFRAAGVARGARQERLRPRADTLPLLEEAASDDFTEIDVDVLFDDPDD